LGSASAPQSDSVVRGLRDAATGTLLIPRLRVARTPWARMKGLLGTRALGVDEGLWITPSNQVHTIGMRYALDLVFVDAENRVVAVEENVAPGRIVRKVRRVSSVLELPAGAISSISIPRSSSGSPPRSRGPARWEGKVLDQMYRMMGGNDGRFHDEPTISIATARRHSGIRRIRPVKNLGVSMRGTSPHPRRLFPSTGKAPSTRDANGNASRRCAIQTRAPSGSEPARDPLSGSSLALATSWRSP